MTKTMDFDTYTIIYTLIREGILSFDEIIEIFNVIVNDASFLYVKELLAKTIQ